MEPEEGQAKRIGRASVDFHVRNPDWIGGPVRVGQGEPQADQDAATPVSPAVSGQLRERQSDIGGDRVCGALGILLGQDSARRPTGSVPGLGSFPDNGELLEHGIWTKSPVRCSRWTKVEETAIIAHDFLGRSC